MSRLASAVPRVSTRGPSAAFVIGAGTALCAVVAGVAIGRESRVALLALAAVALAAGALLIADQVFYVFLGWIAIEGLAWPFIRYPIGRTAYFTLDRYVLIALGAGLTLSVWPKMSVRTRRMTLAFGLLAVGYGARALLTNPLPTPPGRLPLSTLQPAADWLDSILLPFVVFLVAARTVTPARWPLVAKCLTVLGVTSAIVALLEWALGFQLATLAGQQPFFDGAAGVVRSGGPYPTPTTLGAVMIVCLAATLYWMQSEKAYALGVSAIVIQLLGLAPGLTKTVWAAAFVTILIGVGVRRRVSSRTALVGLYSVAAIGVIYAFVQNSAVVASRVTSSASQDNLTGRFAVWHQALYIWQKWPVFGAGIDQFIPAQALVPPVYVDGVAAVSSPHNVAIGMLAEAGAVGAVLLLVFCYQAFRLARASRTLARSNDDVLFRATFVAVLVGYLLQAQTFGILYEPPSAIFLGLMLGVAAARVDHMKRAREAAEAG